MANVEKMASMASMGRLGWYVCVCVCVCVCLCAMLITCLSQERSEKKEILGPLEVRSQADACIALHVAIWICRVILHLSLGTGARGPRGDQGEPGERGRRGPPGALL